MMLRLLAIAAALALAFPAAAQQAKDKPAAKAATGPVATVNGEKIPQARLDFVLQQQLQRGAPDTDGTREAVREDLINREVVEQAAVRAGLAKKPDVKMQMDISRQEVLVGSYLSEYLREHPVTDADVQKEYDRVRAQTGKSEYKSSHILVETEDGQESIPADTVIMAVGSRSVNELAPAVMTEGVKVITLGDAKEPRKLTEAIREGFEEALKL